MSTATLVPSASIGSHARGAAVRQTTMRARRTLLARATQVVCERYAEPLQITDVAEQLGCSRRQLQRVYHDAGMPGFRSQLAMTRMHHAAALLQSSPATPVSEIGAAVGYQSSSQFIKTFRRHHGITPATYRAQA